MGGNPLFILLLGLALLLWTWAFYDIATLRFRGGQKRIIWFLIIVVFPILGPIIFFQAKKRITQPKRKFNGDPDKRLGKYRTFL